MLEMFKKREPPRRADEDADEHNAVEPALPGHDRDASSSRCGSSRRRRRARRGNRIGAAGMPIAIVVTLRADGLARATGRSRSAMAIGGAFGAVARAPGEDDRDAADGGAVQRRRRRRGGARRARGVPQSRARARAICRSTSRSRSSLSALIGSISFAGSMVAFAKLQELISGPADHLSGPAVRATRSLFAAVVALGVAIVAGAEEQWLLVRRARRRARSSASSSSCPIGGADMPVVISLLNAFTGLAAAATGFELENNVLIVSGMLVGASGTLLTLMMGRAMNRSIANVLFGAFGQVAAGGGAAAAARRRHRALGDRRGRRGHARLRAARSSSCPGYGLAVAQAQHDVRAARRPARGEGRRGHVRDPPGRRPDAGPHERAARRGERALSDS